MSPTIRIITALTFLYVLTSLSHAATQPNIILIVTDDQGYADAGFRDPQVHTPNLDKLVESGIELKRFYTAPVCSPTRAGLMTGRYPIRFGMQRAVNRPFSEVGLPDNLTTLPEALEKAGYKHRHIVGKWHLGNMLRAQLPMSHGFTSQYGPYCSGIGYFNHMRFGVHDFHLNQQPNVAKGYYTDLLSDETVRIIDSHGSDERFFIYLPYGAPHTPLQAPEEEITRYRNMGFEEKRAVYLAMVTVIDQGIGRILKALERNEIANNTFILLISDNGGYKLCGNNAPLRGGKSTLYEGGIRVIATACWPERIKAGTVSNAMVSYIDVMPTILDAAGATELAKEEQLDGSSALSLWDSNKKTVDRSNVLYSFYEHNKRKGDSGERLSIIEGDWKLIRRGSPILSEEQTQETDLELYDLSVDLSETTNLADQHPELVSRMLKMLEEFRALRPEGGVPPMVEPIPNGWKPYPNWEPIE